MDKVYLYVFKDSDCGSEDYYIITKHNCKDLIKDIEDYYYDIIDTEDKDELIAYLEDEKASKQLIDFIKKESTCFESCYELELAILNELGEIVNCKEETFYY